MLSHYYFADYLKITMFLMHWQIGIIRFFSTSHVKQNSQGDQNQQGN